MDVADSVANGVIERDTVADDDGLIVVDATADFAGDFDPHSEAVDTDDSELDIDKEGGAEPEALAKKLADPFELPDTSALAVVECELEGDAVWTPVTVVRTVADTNDV